jgi:2-haloacid dehalogenase
MDNREAGSNLPGATLSRRTFAAAVGGLAANLLAGPAVGASMRPIKAIAFDAFTVFDAKHVVEIAEHHFAGAGSPLVSAWTNKLFSLSWFVTAADNYRDFLTISDAALQSVADGMKIGLPDEARRELVDSFAELSVWPDVEPVLDRLRKAGIRLRLLSNLGEAALHANMQKGGIAHYFEGPLSTDRVRQFKPSPRAYHMAVDAFGLAADQIGFAAFASWDALGATWFGYRTAWINRGKAPAENLTPAPAITTTGFDGVLQLVGI